MAYNRTLQHFTSSQELATIWASGQSYIVDQLVLQNNVIYKCAIAHTSSVSFTTDFNAGKWTGIEILTVAASYGHTAGQSIPSGITTAIDFSVQNYDTNSMYTAGVGYNPLTGAWATYPKVTVPFTGKYSIKYRLLYDQNTFTQGNSRNIYIYKNNSTVIAENDHLIPYTSAVNKYLDGFVISVDVNLAAGDYLSFYTYQTEGSARSLYNGGSAFTGFEIIKVGS